MGDEKLPSVDLLKRIFDGNVCKVREELAKESAQFQEFGFVVIPSLVTDRLAGTLFNYAVARAESGTMRTDAQVPNTPSAYADPIMEELLGRLATWVEVVAHVSLYPTYSYFRVYKRGDTLKKHLDRPSCEFSMTLCLGYIAEMAWPLSVRNPKGTFSYALEPGDAVLYKGTEIEHWRDAFIGERVAQVFLHYVSQTGPYSEYRFDGRTNISGINSHRLGPQLVRMLQKLYEARGAVGATTRELD